jgi:SAM-dependent methyltransferase
MMSNKNIEYRSDQFVKFFSENRRKWDDFYASEKWAFEKIAKENNTLGDLLDVGCSCGGLGSALCERSIIKSYTGIDIHKKAIGWAKEHTKLPVATSFMAKDVVEAKIDKMHDTVVSLSCADWNIETSKIIDKCWALVKRGGHLVISLRLTPLPGLNNITKSYQDIVYFEKEKNPEIANYVVFNFKDALRLFTRLLPAPESIAAYGYWGAPSVTAHTPYDKLVFSVFCIRKPVAETKGKIGTEFYLPVEIYL